MAPRRQPEVAKGTMGAHAKSSGLQPTAHFVSIKQMYAMHLSPAAIRFSDLSECFDLAHQGSRTLIFCGLHQNGPVITCFP